MKFVVGDITNITNKFSSRMNERQLIKNILSTAKVGHVSVAHARSSVNGYLCCLSPEVQQEFFLEEWQDDNWFQCQEDGTQSYNVKFRELMLRIPNELPDYRLSIGGVKWETYRILGPGEKIFPHSKSHTLEPNFRVFHIYSEIFDFRARGVTYALPCEMSFRERKTSEILRLPPGRYQLTAVFKDDKLVETAVSIIDCCYYKIFEDVVDLSDE